MANEKTVVQTNGPASQAILSGTDQRRRLRAAPMSSKTQCLLVTGAGNFQDSKEDRRLRGEQEADLEEDATSRGFVPCL